MPMLKSLDNKNLLRLPPEAYRKASKGNRHWQIPEVISGLLFFIQDVSLKQK